MNICCRTSREFGSISEISLEIIRHLMEHEYLLENFLRMSSQSGIFQLMGPQSSLFPKAHHCPLSWSRWIQSTFLTDKLNWSRKFRSASHDVWGFLRGTLCILVDECFHRLDGECCTNLQSRRVSREEKWGTFVENLGQKEELQANRSVMEVSSICSLLDPFLSLLTCSWTLRSTLKMKATGVSETLVLIYHNTCHNQENCNPHSV
jgi:hypothetical protein